MPARSKNFQRRLDAALDDPNLATALHRALSTFRDRRTAAFADLDFEAMRTDLHRRKADAIARLPDHRRSGGRAKDQAGSQEQVDGDRGDQAQRLP
jgi:L-lactate utilization protein LutB